CPHLRRASRAPISKRGQGQDDSPEHRGSVRRREPSERRRREAGGRARGKSAGQSRAGRTAQPGKQRDEDSTGAAQPARHANVEAARDCDGRSAWEAGSTSVDGASRRNAEEGSGQSGEAGGAAPTTASPS